MKTIILLLLTTLILSCGGASGDGSDTDPSESEETDFSGFYSIKDSNCITTTQSITISQSGNSLTIEDDNGESVEGDIISMENGATGFEFYDLDNNYCIGAFIDAEDEEGFEEEGLNANVGDLGILCYSDDAECIATLD